jgi:hypothetical protein
MCSISIFAEDLLGLLFLVWLVDIIHGEDSQMSVITEISKSKSRSWFDA